MAFKTTYNYPNRVFKGFASVTSFRRPSPAPKTSRSQNTTDPIRSGMSLAAQLNNGSKPAPHFCDIYPTRPPELPERHRQKTVVNKRSHKCYSVDSGRSAVSEFDGGIGEVRTDQGGRGRLSRRGKSRRPGGRAWFSRDRRLLSKERE